MSVPPTRQQSLAIKGPRKWEPSSSSDSSTDPFRGCRDSRSTVCGDTFQRAVKSRRLHHRVVLETSLMYRHVLEEHLENLWETCGMEHKFIPFSADQEDMEFFEGPPPPQTGTVGAVMDATTRQVVSVPLPGFIRVTASSSATGQSGLDPSPAPKRPC